jgi:hypothetical protein
VRERLGDASLPFGTHSLFVLVALPWLLTNLLRHLHVDERLGCIPQRTGGGDINCSPRWLAHSKRLGGIVDP